MAIRIGADRAGNRLSVRSPVAFVRQLIYVIVLPYRNSVFCTKFNKNYGKSIKLYSKLFITPSPPLGLQMFRISAEIQIGQCWSCDTLFRQTARGVKTGAPQPKILLQYFRGLLYGNARRLAPAHIFFVR
jgi:hypothetical protein